MHAPSILRLAVIGVELFLTFALINWMRNESGRTPLPWRVIFSVLGAGAFVAVISAFVTLKYSFDIPSLELQFPQVVDHRESLFLFLNILGAALVEELAKYTVGSFLLLSNRSIKRMSDLIACMVITGLGFALIEDILYLVTQVDVGPYRLLSFYLHAGTSAIMGYSLARFHFGLTGYRELFRAVGAAILLHLGYNLATQLDEPRISLVLSFGITMLITLQIFILYRRTLAEEYALERKLHPQKRAVNTTLLNL